MNGDRTQQAHARIEAALARIEAAARKTDGATDQAGLADLQVRHDRLRAVVQQSLGELDLLITNAEG